MTAVAVLWDDNLSTKAAPCLAGALMVEEAGGKVLDPAGGPFDVMSRRVLAGNAHLAAPAAAIIARCKTSSKEAQPTNHHQ